MEERLSTKIHKVDKKVDKGFEEVNDRLDKQGAQLAYLEDDGQLSKNLIV